jgi:FkbH-like protein
MSVTLENPAKLVIWDLDETFWRGTLAEEGITPIPRNAEIVRALSARGIINSICSKNDFDQAKAKLEEIGIWEHFVFPAIDFKPKGKAIAEMIEAIALRPENVLLLDDNALNREEAKFFSPGLMTHDPAVLDDGFLEAPELAGKPDPELTRLKQYQLLERKASDKAKNIRSNEEFLKNCNIRVTIDHNVEANFARVLELINRTNQLNYTKERVHGEEQEKQLRELLGSYSYHAGCVYVTDNYGDYGLVGFFLMQRRAGINKLIHFVFSCRTMHMGVEQYVYEMLGHPEIEVVGPTSYGLYPHARVNWITSDNLVHQKIQKQKGRKLVLVGGCDLLQLASYCSNDRHEFVNREHDMGKARFEDPGFITGDREAIKNCEGLRILPSWTHEDCVSFDLAVERADLILLSMWPAMNGEIYCIDKSVRVRLSEKQILQFGGKKRKLFRETFEKMAMSEDDRLQEILRAFDVVAAKAPRAIVFALGCYTQGEMNDEQVRKRLKFNAACRAYCESNPRKFRYVDVDALVSPDKLVGKTHFSREGYLALAGHILDRADAPTKRPVPQSQKPKTEQPVPIAAERSTPSSLRHILGSFVSRITG